MFVQIKRESEVSEVLNDTRLFQRGFTAFLSHFKIMKIP